MGGFIFNRNSCFTLKTENIPMTQYKYLTGPDDEAFYQRVTDALNNSWELYGHPTLTYDIKQERVICGLTIVKKVAEGEFCNINFDTTTKKRP